MSSDGDMGDGDAEATDHHEQGDHEVPTHHQDPPEATHQGGAPAEHPQQPEVAHQGGAPAEHPQQPEATHQGGAPAEHPQQPEATQIRDQEEPSHGGAPAVQPSVDTANLNPGAHDQPTVIDQPTANAEHQEGQQQEHKAV